MENQTTVTLNPDLIAQAKKLFDAVWQYYMFKVTCIKPEDYERMQEIIGYKQSYEAYMATIVNGVPHEPWIMIQHIGMFLREYIEFQDPKYVAKIQEHLRIVERDRELYKRKAFEILVKMNRNNVVNDDAESDEAEAEEDDNGEPETDDVLGFHPPLFELDTGANGAKIILPTYGNPMMTSLYSILFTSFQHFQMQDMELALPLGQ